MCVCMCMCCGFLLSYVQWKKKVNTLKWIGPQENLHLGYSFFFNTCFWRFKSFPGSKWFILMFPLVFKVVSLLTGFVSVDVQFELIVRDKLSCLQMFFLSIFTRVYSVCLCVCVCISVHVFVYAFRNFFCFCFSLLLLFSTEIMYDSWYAIKFNWLVVFLPEWLCVSVRAYS